MNNAALEQQAINIIAENGNNGIDAIQSALKAEGFTLHYADGKQQVYTADGVNICAFEFVKLRGAS